MVVLINYRSVLNVRSSSDESYLPSDEMRSAKCSNGIFFEMLAVVCMYGLLSCNLIF